MGTYKINTSKQSPARKDLDLKISEFTLAMQHYNNRTIYTRMERANSCFILCLQIITLFNVVQHYDGTSVPIIMGALAAGYVFTDFINGLVHMYMDNNTNYKSMIGPFVSSFHLHHTKIKYTARHPIKVYFYESGTKFWLLAYLLAIFATQCYFTLPYSLDMFLVSVGIMSSIAELSHYWCHNTTPKNTWINKLQKYGILLSKKHHAKHHKEDNTHYAFLNGMTDPLLNKIAHYFYSGYKNQADEHTTGYVKKTQTGFNNQTESAGTNLKINS